MRNELVHLLKSIGLYDVIFGCIISTVLWMFFGSAAVLFLIGLALGFINFLINSYATKRMINKKSKSGLFFVLSLLVRITIICGTAIIIFMKSEVNFFIFISGYISQILSIVCYGVKLRRRKEVWFCGGINSIIFY